jgi:CHASE1-domain containing sensor protein
LQHGCSTQSLTHQHNLNDTRMQFVTFTNALDTDKECMALPMLRVAPLGFMLTSPRVL